jgi:hypothetical protein
MKLKLKLDWLCGSLLLSASAAADRVEDSIVSIGIDKRQRKESGESEVAAFFRLRGMDGES